MTSKNQTHFALDFWDGSEYSQNSSIQAVAATQLLRTLPLSECSNVLDIGCGDGKITAQISKLTEFTGRVKGIDRSQNMINFACTHYPKSACPNLDFACEDAEELSEVCQFDLVFSSFALQWIQDLYSCFLRVYKSLRPNGFFAATLPYSISSELAKSINYVTSKNKWSEFFANTTNLPMPEFVSANEINHLLSKSQFYVNHCSSVTQTHRFKSKNQFFNYIKQWLPHQSALPESYKNAFLEAVVNNYLRQVPMLISGEVVFTFERVDFVAKKAYPSY